MTDLDPHVPSRDAPVPLPTALSDAPTSQGMVVPYITLAHRDRSRAVWGNVAPLRLHEVLYHKLCQICGTPLGEQVIVFIRPSDFHQGVAVEPGLHPSCADYSTGTCPMLAGRMHHYHRHPGQRITRCTDPGCHCRAWAPPRPDPVRDGSPTEAWYELRLPLEEYHVITVPGYRQTPSADWYRPEDTAPVQPDPEGPCCRRPRPAQGRPVGDARRRWRIVRRWRSVSGADRALSRIAGLLRKAEGTDNAHEAEIFLARAQELATRHSIDLALARAVEPPRTRATPATRQITIGEPGTRGLSTYVQLFLAIAGPNDVRVDIARNSTWVIAFGMKSDIAAVEVLYSSLLPQMIQRIPRLPAIPRTPPATRQRDRESGDHRATGLPTRLRRPHRPTPRRDP